MERLKALNISAENTKNLLSVRWNVFRRLTSVLIRGGAVKTIFPTLPR